MHDEVLHTYTAGHDGWSPRKREREEACPSSPPHIALTMCDHDFITPQPHS